MEKQLEQLSKAVTIAEQSAQSLLKSEHPDHVAYTRTSASGTVSNISAKGAPHPKDKSALHGEIWGHMKQQKDLIDMPEHLQTKAGKKAYNELQPAYKEFYHSDEGKMSRLHPSHVDTHGEINVGPHTLRHNYSGKGYVIESRMPHMNGKVIEAKFADFDKAKRQMIYLAQSHAKATAGQ